MRPSRSVDPPSLLIVAIIVLASSLLDASRASDRPSARVLPIVDRPGNPDVAVATGRVETSFDGRFDPLTKQVTVLKAFNARFELNGGESQCFYCVLLTGHHYIQDAQTVRFFQESNFDAFISDGYGKLIYSNFEGSLIRHEMVINDTDTYETCIVNRGQRKMIAYSAYRVIPPELLGENNQMAKLHNFSNSATTSVGQLEMRMATVLSYVRAHSEVYKDTAALIATNSSIQWKAWVTLALQLASFGLTTGFIRRLFKAPVGKFAAST